MVTTVMMTITASAVTPAVSSTKSSRLAPNWKASTASVKTTEPSAVNGKKPRTTLLHFLPDSLIQVPIRLMFPCPRSDPPIMRFRHRIVL